MQLTVRYGSENRMNVHGYNMGLHQGGEKISIRQIWLHIVLPILIGSIIYILYRHTTLLVFKWIDLAGWTPFIMQAREWAAWSLPAFVKYSVPDGLWAYAFAYTIYQIWRESGKAVTYSIIFGIPSIGIFSELLQIPHIIQGTFDLNDVIAYSIAAIILYIISTQKGNIQRHEKDHFHTNRLRHFWYTGSRKHEQR